MQKQPISDETQEADGKNPNESQGDKCFSSQFLNALRVLTFIIDVSSKKKKKKNHIFYCK